MKPEFKPSDKDLIGRIKSAAMLNCRVVAHNDTEADRLEYLAHRARLEPPRIAFRRVGKAA